MIAPRSPVTASEPVRIVTIDDTCRDLGCAPDWIRIDVQGFEFEVLEGASGMLRDRRGRVRVVAEMHPDQWPDYGIDAREVPDRLAALGLRARSLVSGEDAFAQGAHAILEPLD
jgi:hypothetical protein